MSFPLSEAVYFVDPAKLSSSLSLFKLKSVDSLAQVLDTAKAAMTGKAFLYWDCFSKRLLQIGSKELSISLLSVASPMFVK